jgi:hypothetical protein
MMACLRCATHTTCQGREIQPHINRLNVVSYGSTYLVCDKRMMRLVEAEILVVASHDIHFSSI